MFAFPTRVAAWMFLYLAMGAIAVCRLVDAAGANDAAGSEAVRQGDKDETRWASLAPLLNDFA